jgi:hypothetical protein
MINVKERYKIKFNPGYHYTEAYKAIASFDYGIVSFSNGLCVSSGTISALQAEKLLREGIETTSKNKNGVKHFIVPNAIFEVLSDEYKKMKDDYIIDNNIVIDNGWRT